MILTIFECSPVNAIWLEIVTRLCKADLDAASVIQYSAIISGFISITLPISLDIVSRHSEDFKDKDISILFLSDWKYRFQVYINLVIVFISILLISLKLYSFGWMLFVVIMDFIAIVVFILFIRMVQVYATNFADYYSGILKNDSDEIVRGE